MSKNIHNPNSFQKAARHGQQQGFGPFRPRPKRLDAITLLNRQAPGDLPQGPTEPTSRSYQPPSDSNHGG